MVPTLFYPLWTKLYLIQALKGVRFAVSPAFRPQYIAKTSLKSGVFPVLATYSRHSFCTCSSSYSWLILGVTTYTLEYWKHRVRTHLHQANRVRKRSKNKQNRSKNKRQTSKKNFAFAFTFSRSEHSFKAHSHQEEAKAKISFDVCRFFFDLFHFGPRFRLGRTCY